MLGVVSNCLVVSCPNQSALPYCASHATGWGSMVVVSSCIRYRQSSIAEYMDGLHGCAGTICQVGFQYDKWYNEKLNKSNGDMWYIG